MNTNRKGHFAFGCLIALSFVFASAMTLPAQADTSYPVSIQVALVTPPVLSQGEPVMLRYQIANTSEQKIAERLGSSRDEWYTLSLISNDGQAATRLPKPAAPKPSGLYIEPTVNRQPGETSDGYIAATQSLMVSHPGKYVLSVHVHLPIAALGALPEGADEGFIAAHGQTWSQNFNFPLTITPADPNRLKTTAEALRQAIVQEKNVARRDADAEALFSIPEAAALPSWQAIAFSSSLPVGLQWTVAQQLAQKRSSGTADALAAIVWSQTSPADVMAQQTARAGLSKMYEAGDAALQQHIQQIYARHGEKEILYSSRNDN